MSNDTERRNIESKNKYQDLLRQEQETKDLISNINFNITNMQGLWRNIGYATCVTLVVGWFLTILGFSLAFMLIAFTIASWFHVKIGQGRLKDYEHQKERILMNS